MKARVEWIKGEWETGVLRVGPNLEKHGDPYEASCTILRNGDEGILLGFSGKFERSTRRAIVKALQEEGLTKMRWERMKEIGILFKEAEE